MKSSTYPILYVISEKQFKFSITYGIIDQHGHIIEFDRIYDTIDKSFTFLALKEEYFSEYDIIGVFGYFVSKTRKMLCYLSKEDVELFEYFEKRYK